MQRLNNTALRVTLYFIAIFLTYVVWVYIEKIGPFWVSRDQFQFLRLIETHFNGTLRWQDFFTSHSEHVKPLYLFGFYLNALFLGLDLRIEFYLGLIALLMSALILLNRYLLSVVDSTVSNKFVFFSSIAILMQVFSFNQHASFGFSQLMFGGYAQTLLFVCIFIAADDLWLRRPSVGQLVLVTFLIIFATFTFAGARMPVMLLALLSAPVILFFFKAELDAPQFKYALVILSVGILSLFIFKELSTTHDKGGHSIGRLLSNPKDVWMFISGAIAGSISPVDFFRRQGWTNLHFACLGTLLGFMYLVVLINYLKNGLWKVTLIPFMMFIYGMSFILAVTYARYGNGYPIHTALSPRYVFDTQLGFIGVMWMFFLHYRYVKSQSAAALARGNILVVIFLVTVVTVQLSIFAYEWNKAKHRQRAWENVESMIAVQVDEPQSTIEWPNWYGPSNKHCQKGVLFLKEHSLNIFSTLD